MTATVPLESLVDSNRPITYGIVLPGPDVPDGVPYVRVVDMKSGTILAEQLRRTTPEIAQAYKRSMLAEGDLVVSIRGHVGRTALVPRSVDGANLTQDTARVAIAGAEPRYVRWFLESPTARHWMVRHTKGVAVTGINLGDLRRLPVPHVPLAAQRRIADILDKADAIRRKRKEAIALIEVLLRSTFLEMFGDPVTNPKGWPTESIDSLCSRGADLVDGPFGSSLKPEHYVASGVKVVRNWNIYDDRFDFTEFKYVNPAKFDEIRRSEVRAGDVLITTKGTVGDVCVAPDLGGAAVLSASGTVRLRLPPDDSYLPEFVVGQMISRTYKSYLHTFEAGSAQQYLNLSAIRKMRLIRPPMKDQAEFRTFRSCVQDSQRVIRAAHEGTQILFNSLVARAFSGSLEATAW